MFKIIMTQTGVSGIMEMTCLEHLDIKKFGFVSDFDIRISNFRKS